MVSIQAKNKFPCAPSRYMSQWVNDQAIFSKDWIKPIRGQELGVGSGL